MDVFTLYHRSVETWADRVNAVAPTYIETAMNAYVYQDENLMRHWIGGTPQGRMGQPDEVAAAVLYLCSPGAGAVTGQSIVVAGGELM